MTTNETQPNRKKAVQQIVLDERRRNILQTRALAWATLIRGAAALGREYAQDDGEIVRYMSNLTVRAIEQKRLAIREIESLNKRIAYNTTMLRASQGLDELRGDTETFYEMAENDGEI